ncbi:hypothetical protein ACWECC_18060 [Streptomyces microflavus]
MKRYELRAEVYPYSFYQNESGTIVEVWDYENPVYIKATGGSVRPWDSIEKFQGQYEYGTYLELYTPTEVSVRERVGKVSNRDKSVYWAEIDGEPTTFNVYGCFPNLDAYGNLVDYQVILKRGDVQ